MTITSKNLKPTKRQYQALRRVLSTSLAKQKTYIATWRSLIHHGWLQDSFGHTELSPSGEEAFVCGCRKYESEAVQDSWKERLPRGPWETK